MKKHLLSSVFAAGAIAAASIFQAAPAEALSFDGQLAIFGRNDVYSSGSDLRPEAERTFTVDFVDSFANSVPNNQLRSTAKFTINSFLTSGGQTTVGFKVDLANISTTNSLLRAIGFNVGSITGNTVNDNIGINTSQTSATGRFSQVLFNQSGSFPGMGGVNRREVEFRANSASDRIPEDTNSNTGSFIAQLVLNEEVQQVSWYDFAVRYQGLTEIPDGESEGSGAGRPIPTPALLPGLVGLAAGALRKKQAEAAQDA
ncbi:MAG: cistern family PEP-CTERM protein [Leptolyngbyaceae cyanobacterium SL_7_1]|nr:cistern family PEP-CTERM protein [Leptolyngbyaceae cyanobacterium SL_7_1]